MRCGSELGLAIANTSTWSPPTLAAIEAKSVVEAATLSFAWLAAGAMSVAAANAATRSLRIMSGLLELVGLVRAHREDDAKRDLVDRIEQVRRGGRDAGALAAAPVQPERRGLLHERETRERAHGVDALSGGVRVLVPVERAARVVALLPVVVGEHVAAMVLVGLQRVRGARLVPAGVVAVQVQ